MVDVQEHNQNKILEKYLEIELKTFLLGVLIEDDDCEKLAAAIKSGIPTDNYIPLNKCEIFHCPNCSEELKWEFNGVNLRIQKECPFPNGHPPFVFELNVPSGKMIVANDLRTEFPIIGDYNINTISGERQTTMKYAEFGMAHCFVGNTCPSMRKRDKKKLSEKFDIRPFNGKSVASICTDLWWYSIADFDAFTKAIGHEPGEKDLKNKSIVNCRPGVYRFTHQYHIAKASCKLPYSTIEWVREPDPVVDYKAKYNAINFTAGQIVKSMLSKDVGWEERYKNFIGDLPPNHEIFRVVNQIFCVSGNGFELHPNGWLGNDPDLTMDSPSIEIPILEGKFMWYPISSYTFLAHCCGVGKLLREKNKYLNKSFLDLAFNICQNIITYGVKIYNDNCRSEESRNKEEKEIVNLVKKCCLKLAEDNEERLPDFILPVLQNLKG